MEFDRIVQMVGPDKGRLMMAGQNRANLLKRLTQPRKKRVQPHQEFQIETLINAAGRLDYDALSAGARAYGQAMFAQAISRPVLAGSAFYSGGLETQPGAKMTKLFKMRRSSVREDLTSSKNLDQAIYPLIKRKYASTAPRLFRVGRTGENDMVMPDYTISRHHAEIQIVDDGYVLRDCGATNGVFLNGVRLKPKEEHHIKERDEITFARYQFTFVFPNLLFARLLGLDEEEGADTVKAPTAVKEG
ncbi:MAG: FHA domain-containing protein [Magnetococcales bacterium]|nr:FHA domain-containing protein [Magnetococcales bacterium]